MNVRELLKQQEGDGLPGKPFEAYKCPKGKWTIGWGRNIEAKGLRITRDQAEALLSVDIADAAAGARRLVANFDQLNNVRQAVLVSMIFQLGEAGFGRFKKTRRFIEAGDFKNAAVEMLDSPWAKAQTPKRAKQLARMMRDGRW